MILLLLFSSLALMLTHYIHISKRISTKCKKLLSTAVLDLLVFSKRIFTSLCSKFKKKQCKVKCTVIICQICYTLWFIYCISCLLYYLPTPGFTISHICGVLKSRLGTTEIPTAISSKSNIMTTENWQMLVVFPSLSPLSVPVN